nr:unnamed protein product [Digitaria exilis]
MNPPSERQGVQQKKSRKPYSIPRRAAAPPTGGPTAGSPSNVALADGPAAGSRGNRAPAGSPGSASPSTGAPTSGQTGHHPPHVFLPATSLGSTFTVDSSPGSSEWLYPPGGFMSYLQMPQTSPPQPYPFVNYPSASYLPENSHFVGAPSCRGTPSPNGNGLAMDAADTQEEESIDIDDDDTLEPARTEKRLNYSHEEDIRLIWACSFGVAATEEPLIC